jgi:hypothetical protein
MKKILSPTTSLFNKLITTLVEIQDFAESPLVQHIGENSLYISPASCTVYMRSIHLSTIISALCNLGSWTINSYGNPVLGLHFAAVLDGLAVGTSLASASCTIAPNAFPVVSDAKLISLSSNGDSYDCIVKLGQRHATCALGLTQLVTAAIIGAEYTKDSRSFHQTLAMHTALLTASLLKHYDTLQSTTHKLKADNDRYSVPALRRSAKSLAFVASVFAEEVIYKSNISIEQYDNAALGRRIHAAAVETGVSDNEVTDTEDCSAALACLHAFAGESDEQVGLGAVRICQVSHNFNLLCSICHSS